MASYGRLSETLGDHVYLVLYTLPGATHCWYRQETVGGDATRREQGPSGMKQMRLKQEEQTTNTSIALNSSGDPSSAAHLNKRG